MSRTFFNVLKIFFLGYGYIITTSYFMSMFRFFALAKKLDYLTFSSIQFYILLSFILTSIFIVLIRFSLLNILAFVLSILIEFLVNKTLLFYFYPLTYFFSFSYKEIPAFPIGFLLYLAYFLSPKKDIKEFLFFFVINLFILILWQFTFLKVNVLLVKIFVDFAIILYFVFYDELYNFVKTKIFSYLYSNSTKN